jgi:hypothetical protein
MKGPIILKKTKLELLIDPPGENYQRTRFDWTGKIRALTYEGKSITGRELLHPGPDQLAGEGFYNEFGIDGPLGYDELPVGEWCHKIGVGRVKKEDTSYDIHKDYDCQPCEFEVEREEQALRLTCHGPLLNGYAYLLKKEIRLLESGFQINYYLENQGEKPILTSEYSHNFLNIDQAPIGEAYRLRFPFELKPEGFGERVNPEGLLTIGQREVTWKGTPKEAFFFSMLSGGEEVEATWELWNVASGMGISETGSFPTRKVNLWGCGHVISPELFFDIRLAPAQSVRWSRTYQVLEAQGLDKENLF